MNDILFALFATTYLYKSFYTLQKNAADVRIFFNKN